MNQILANCRIRIRRNQVMQIKRSLPSSISKINVKVGDEVLPNLILAEGKIASGFRTVNLANELKVNPKEGLKYLKRSLGCNIFKDELLASKEEVLGFGNKIILSPADGMLDYYDNDTGRLKIKLFPKTVKLASGVWGIVEEIDEIKGMIIIKTMASLVYGMFGCGREREGALNVIGSREVLVGSRQLETAMRGQIIVGGEIVFADGLEKAMELGIKGFITGGINARDYKKMASGWNIYQKQWSDAGLSLLVTEGFGSVHIGDDIYSELQQNHGKFSILDGNRNRLILPSDDGSCMIDIRKTKLPERVFIEAKVELGRSEVQLGQKVRIVSQEYLGLQGIVEAIDKTASKLPSGVYTTLVTVNTNLKKIRIAHQNLEIII